MKNIHKNKVCTNVKQSTKSSLRNSNKTCPVKTHSNLQKNSGSTEQFEHVSKARHEYTKHQRIST